MPNYNHVVKSTAISSGFLRSALPFLVAPVLSFLSMSAAARANDRHTATMQIDFKRTMSEKEARETLRDFDVKLVKASNNSSRSHRWTVDIETRDSDPKLDRELKATKGVERVKRIVIKKTSTRPREKTALF